MANSKSVRGPAEGAMTVEIWPIENLIPYARNPRQIPQIAIDKVARSIQEFGFRQPIVVDTKGVIIQTWSGPGVFAFAGKHEAEVEALHSR